MSLPRISLQALEAFERVAQSGSMQIAAKEMGIAISSISHQIGRLEEQLGVDLFDRSSRPFTLTRAGRQALHHLSKGLFHLRRATSETIISGLLGTRSLKIGIIEDFESSVTPELAVILARQMPRAALSIRNILSHEAADLLRKGEIDIAVSSEINEPTAGVSSQPLLRDPYILVLPKGHDIDPAALINEKIDLPFLRFNPRHLIGQQVEAHLARNRVVLASRFAFDSVQSIMAVVASGDGWSIVTSLGFMRAQRFADRVQLHPLPLSAFARTISISSHTDFDSPTKRAIATLFQQIVHRRAVEPACMMFPWLVEEFSLLDSD
mgnify:CR=1 FL=1